MKQFYRVKDGVRHGANNQYGPGDIVELTPEEANGLLDKLELVEGGQESEPTEPSLNTDESEPTEPSPKREGARRKS